MLKNSRGFSLIQVIVAIGLVGVLAVVFAQLLVEMQKEVRRIGAKQGRVLSAYQIDQIALSPFGVKASAALSPENAALKACVLGGSTPTCASNCCQHGQSVGFYLLDPRDLNPDIHLRAKLSGLVDDPVFYDEAGNNKCVTPNCVYRMSTSFVAQCPGGVPSCDHAEHLVLTLSKNVEAGKEYLMKAEKKTLIYFVNLNYQPFINPIADQILAEGTSANISVYGNSGHPSEIQNFIFEKCESANPAVMKITCYGFLNGVGTIRLEGMSPGTTKITLQINDGGLENNLSPDLSFNVQVN